MEKLQVGSLSACGNGDLGGCLDLSRDFNALHGVGRAVASPPQTSNIGASQLSAVKGESLVSEIDLGAVLVGERDFVV